MNKFPIIQNLPFVIVIMAVFSVIGTGCPTPTLVDGNILTSATLKTPIPIQTIPGCDSMGLPFGCDLLELSGFSMDFGDVSNDGGIDELGYLDHVYVEQIGIRTVTNAELDMNEDDQKSALENADLITTCPSGRAELDFIDSLDLYIEIPGDASSKQLLATYRKSVNGNCGFFFDIVPGPDDVSIDLKPYLADYKITISNISGTPQDDDTNIGGFITFNAEVLSSLTFPSR